MKLSFNKINITKPPAEVRNADLLLRNSPLFCLPNNSLWHEKLSCLRDERQAKEWERHGNMKSVNSSFIFSVISTVIIDEMCLLTFVPICCLSLALNSTLIVNFSFYLIYSLPYRCLIYLISRDLRYLFVQLLTITAEVLKILSRILLVAVACLENFSRFMNCYA